MVNAVADYLSNLPEQLTEAARFIGKKGTKKRKVFEAVYHGAKSVKGVVELADTTGLTEKEVVDAGKALSDHQLLTPKKVDGRMAYQKIPFFSRNKSKIIKLADDRKKLERVATKRNVAIVSSKKGINEVRFSTPERRGRKRLRIAFLTTNPDADLRTDNEARQVTQAILRSNFRDQVELKVFPAARFSDLLDALNEFRPNVVHFSGHGGAESIVFDDGDALEPSSLTVDFSVLADTLKSTDAPPKLVVLNACSTLDGSDILLQASQYVIAMSDDILDASATIFATQFYSALAGNQPIGKALKQGCLILKATGQKDNDLPHIISRDGLDPERDKI